LYIFSAAKLSSEGSDSEHEAAPYNEESQSYDYHAASPSQSYTYQQGYVPPEAVEEDANSFDPQAFFDSFAKGQTQAGYPTQAADINTDLQMSDSESENEDEGNFVEVSADMVPDDDDSNFNIEEFLQQQKE
jgi:hypothetical protein